MSGQRLGPITRLAWDEGEMVLLGRCFEEGRSHIPILWNGWRCPAFDRENAQRIVDYNNAHEAESPGSFDTFEWDGDSLIVHSLYDDVDDERIEPVTGPDGKPYWAIGAWYWTWYEVDWRQPR